MRVKDDKTEHTFFIHQFLLSTSQYFKELFASQPGLTEHTLPPGPDVETVGNYVSFLYTRYDTSPGSFKNDNNNNSLSQLISLARVYRFTYNKSLDHDWVMNRAYNAAKDILRNMEISWRNEDNALQAVHKAQSAFTEWSADYSRKRSAWNIAHLIVEKFAQTCPENVYDTYIERLDRNFTIAVTRQLMRDRKQHQDTTLTQSRSSSRMTAGTAGPSTAGPSTAASSVTAGPFSPGSLTTGHRPELGFPLNTPVMKGAPPTIPAAVQHTVSPTIAQGIAPVTPPGFQQATNAQISPPVRQITRHVSLPEIQTRTQIPSPLPAGWPRSPEHAVLHGEPQWPQPALLTKYPQRYGENVPARYRQPHQRSASENVSTENRRQRE